MCLLLLPVCGPSTIVSALPDQNEWSFLLRRGFLLRSRFFFEKNIFCSLRHCLSCLFSKSLPQKKSAGLFISCFPERWRRYLSFYFSSMQRDITLGFTRRRCWDQRRELALTCFLDGKSFIT